MIRTAFDSDVEAAIPQNADFVFLYTDAVPDLAVAQAKFPRSTVLLIDRGLGDPGLRATLLDVEAHAAMPAEIPRWYDERHAIGRQYLTVYCNRDTLPAVNAALAGRAAAHWIATLDGTVHIDGWAPLQGPALVQILGETQLGVHADFSLVLHDDWHPVPQPREPAAVAADLATAQTWNQDVAKALARLQRDLLLPP